MVLVILVRKRPDLGADRREPLLGNSRILNRVVFSTKIELHTMRAIAGAQSASERTSFSVTLTKSCSSVRNRLSNVPELRFAAVAMRALLQTVKNENFNTIVRGRPSNRSVFQCVVVVVIVVPTRERESLFFSCETTNA